MNNAWILPSKLDARWLQVCFLASYVVYAMMSPAFSRSPAQYLAGFASVMAVEWFFLRLKKLPLVPISGLISTMGLCLLTDSPYVWPYAAVGAISMLSKHLVRVDGKHVFNPLNFGVVVGVLFMSHYVTIQPGRWGGSLEGMLAIAILGVLTVWRAGKLGMAAAYVATFLLGAYARANMTGAPFALVAGPATGASFQLFTFFMITDPITTPQKPWPSALFGVAVGALDAVLRYYQVLNAPFLALFALSGLVPLLPKASLGARAWPEPARVG